MLQLNLKYIFANKGIENPNRFLKQCGIGNVAAFRMLNNSLGSLNLARLESICLALNCTIDDLLVWIPDEKSAALSKHPLQKLRQKEDKENLNQKIKQLPFSKLEQVKKYIDQLNEEQQ